MAIQKGGTSGLKAILAQPAFNKRFEEILGKRAPQFVASIIGVAASLPQDTEPTSIVTSAMVAATLDLPINKDLGFAWIVPYRNNKTQRMEAQFQMGHKGFIQLAFRTGQYSRMNAVCVNAEAFGGYDEVGEPIIEWSKIDPSLPVVGYAFAWKLTNGFTKICYWTKKRVEAHAGRYSQAYSKGYQSPWKSHFDQMALKTVIKNELSDWGVLSVEMRQASKFDQSVVLDVESEIVHYPDNTDGEVPAAESLPGPTPPLKSLRSPSAPPATVKAKEAQKEAPKIDEDNLDMSPPSNVVELKPEPEKIAPVKAANVNPPVPQNTTPQNPVSSAATPAPTSITPHSTESSGVKTAPTQEKDIPPAKTPADFLPYIDTGSPEEITKSLREWMGYEEITDAELMQWAAGRKLAKPGQIITDLATAKLIGILKQRESVRVAIIKDRK